MPKKPTTKKPPAPRRRNGRPTLYKPEMAERARARCLLGATNEQLADDLGVDIETVKRWMREIEEFRTAVYEGRDGADQKVVQALYHRAIGYDHDDIHFSSYQGAVEETPYIKHIPPDVEAAKWWLKNRRPNEWKDKQEITGPDGAPLIASITWTVVKPKEGK